MPKLRPTNLNADLKSTFNSDTVELLGYTQEYLSKITGTVLPIGVVNLAHEIALVSARLNTLCATFDKELTVLRISDIQRKQVEWAEMVAAKRAERAAKERVKIVKTLRGIDRKIYERTGDLPHEYEARIKDAFKVFLAATMDAEKG